MAWLKSKKSSVSDLGLPDDFFDIEDYSRLSSLRASGVITEEQNLELEKIIRSNPKLAELEQARIDNLNKLITDSEYNAKYEKTMNELWEKVEKLMKKAPTPDYGSLFPKDDEVRDEFASAVRGERPVISSDKGDEELSEFDRAVKEAEEAALKRESAPVLDIPTPESDGSIDVSDSESSDSSSDDASEEESDTSSDSADAESDDEEEKDDESLEEPEDDIDEESTLEDGAIDPVVSEPPVVDPEEEARHNTPIERSEALDFLYNLHMEKKAKEEHPEPEVIEEPTKIRLMDKDFEVGLDLQNNVEINKSVFDYYENVKFGNSPEADINTLTHIHMLSKLSNEEYLDIITERDELLAEPVKSGTMPEGVTLNNLVFYGEIEAFTNAYDVYSGLLEKESLTDEEKERCKKAEDYLLLILGDEAKKVDNVDKVLDDIKEFEKDHKDELTPFDHLIKKAYEQEKKYRTDGRRLSRLESDIISRTTAEYNNLLDKYGFELGKEIDLDKLTPEEKRLYAEIKLYERNCEDIIMKLSSKDVLTEQERFDLNRCKSSLIVIADVEASHLDNLEEIVKEAEENKDLLTPIREVTLDGYRLALVSRKAKEASREPAPEPVRTEAASEPTPVAPTVPEPTIITPAPSVAPTPSIASVTKLPDLTPTVESDLPDLEPTPEDDLPDLIPDSEPDLPDLTPTKKEESRYKPVDWETEMARVASKKSDTPASDKVIPIRRTAPRIEVDSRSEEMEGKIISMDSKRPDKPVSDEADKLLKAKELANRYKAFQEGLRELGLSSFDELESVLGKVDELGEDKDSKDSSKTK